MDWSKFADLFHPSWETKIRPFIESPECGEIYAQIRAQTGRGKKVVPVYQQTFRAFKETPLDEIKCMLMGLSPYHTLKDGKVIADGVLMSASNTHHLPPSLEKFYEGMEKELFPDSEVGIFRDPDLTYLCKQGVFMFNASMTTELMKAGSHVKIWEPFTKYVLEEIITSTGIPVIWLGKEAKRFDRYVNPFQWRFAVSHPASASYNHTIWDPENAFININKVLKDYNNYHIEWAQELPF